MSSKNKWPAGRQGVAISPLNSSSLGGQPPLSTDDTIAIDWDSCAKRLEEEAVQTGVAIPRVPYGLIVSDRSSAALVIAAIRMAEQSVKNIQAQADAMKAVAASYAEYLRERYEGQLATLVCNEAESGKKSIKLLTNASDKATSLQLRSVPARLDITNTEIAMAWCSEQQPELVCSKTTYSLHKRGLQEHWKQTGEIPPGCEVVEEHEKVYL